MVTDVAIAEPVVATRKQRDFGSSARLFGGFLGRAWLWFIAGCLVVTFLPMLFGWRPYVVESGSMQPRIKVGDVILSSPEHNEQKLLGHVTVFEDPDAAHPGTVKSHRVIKINSNGTMVTKGDANVTPDPVPLPLKNVKGIGRLLVRWIGLPLIWVQQGQWLKLGLLIFSLWLSAFMVMRDHDEPTVDDESDESDDGDGDTDGGPDDSRDPDDPDSDRDFSGYADDFQDDDPDDFRRPGDWGDEPAGRDVPRHLDENSPSEQLQWKPRASGLRRLRRARHRQPLRPAEFARLIVVRLGVVLGTAAGLFVPTVHAALSATTVSTTSTWSTAASFAPSYTTDTQALNPYLYWKLDDSSGSSAAADSSGNNRPGLYGPSALGGSTWTAQQAGALAPSQTPNYSVLETGVTSTTNPSCITTNSAAENPAPVTYSEIIWFKTPAPVTVKKKTTYYSGGGKLIGFESQQTGLSDNSKGGQYDRMIYMDSAGHLTFGVWTGATTTAATTGTYNDGNWHMAVATMGGGTGGDGMNLYVDGLQVASNANTTSQDYTSTNGGWWRVGCGNLEGWGSDWPTQTNYAFSGNLDEATVFTTELTAQNVATLYSDANYAGASPPPPSLSFTNGDFETGQLSPWTCTSGGGIVTNPTHGGTYALSVTNTFFGTSECDQNVTGAPNHTYTLTGFLNGNQAMVGVSGGATGSSQPGGAGWVPASFTFTTDSTGAFTVYVRSSYWLGTTIYADDITIS
ncbi:MAG: signal peptidase I [Acidothermaceae bacterium]